MDDKATKGELIPPQVSRGAREDAIHVLNRMITTRDRESKHLTALLGWLEEVDFVSCGPDVEEALYQILIFQK